MRPTSGSGRSWMLAGRMGAMGCREGAAIACRHQRTVAGGRWRQQGGQRRRQGAEGGAASDAPRCTQPAVYSAVLLSYASA